MARWHLTNREWQLLAEHLTKPQDKSGAGRPRIDNERAIAQACLYRFFHLQQSGYRCFGWNQLPNEFGVSPSTANRRFREWTENGSWDRFWHALLVHRREHPSRLNRPNSPTNRSARNPPRSPTPESGITDHSSRPIRLSELVAELERAYLFFNTNLFGNALPSDVAIALERDMKRHCSGYFGAEVWSVGNKKLHHIALNTSIFGGTESVLAVLLHEMVHLRNNHFGIRDCDPQNQYHNRYFRDVAILAGLACAKRHAKFGYGFTRFNAEGEAAITALAPDESLFQWTAR